MRVRHLRRRWPGPVVLLHLHRPAHVLAPVLPWLRWERPAMKDIRVSLNLTPDMYKELIRWADSAAAAVDVPRISQQDALRAMLRGTLDSTAATSAALKVLRKDRA